MFILYMQGSYDVTVTVPFHTLCTASCTRQGPGCSPNCNPKVSAGGRVVNLVQTDVQMIKGKIYQIGKQFFLRLGAQREIWPYISEWQTGYKSGHER